MKILDLCRTTCDECPFTIKYVCDRDNNNKIVIVHDEKEVYQLPYNICKVFQEYESFHHIVDGNSYKMVDIRDNHSFYLFTVKYSKLTQFLNRNTTIIFDSELTKIDNLLNTTPIENIDLLEYTYTSSYKPTLNIPYIQNNSDTELEINATVVGLDGHVPTFTIDEQITFTELLRGNNVYTIKIDYVEKVNGVIVDVIQRTFYLSIIKNRLCDYSYVELNDTEIITVDKDDDVRLVIPNISDFNISDIDIVSDVPYRILDWRLNEGSDSTDLILDIGFIGYLQSGANTLDIIINGTKYEFTYNVSKFHSCTNKINFSDLYILNSNITNTNKSFYIINNTNNPLEFNGLIGYSILDIEKRPIC